MIIENMYFPTGSFSSDNVVLLGHVASPVDLSLVVDLTVNLDAFILSLNLVPAHSTSSLVREPNFVYTFQVARSSSSVLKSSIRLSFSVNHTSLSLIHVLIEAFVVLSAIFARLEGYFDFDYLQGVLLVI
jgi:hypothetical protein